MPSQVCSFFNFAEAEDGDATLSLVRPRSRRSGCVPALPYPPLRSGVVYRDFAKQAPCGRQKQKTSRKKCLTAAALSYMGRPIGLPIGLPIGPQPAIGRLL